MLRTRTLRRRGAYISASIAILPSPGQANWPIIVAVVIRSASRLLRRRRRRSSGWRPFEYLMVRRSKTQISPSCSVPRSRAVATPFSTIERERVTWLDDGRIAMASLNLLAGEPGLGKSLYSTLVAAEVTRAGRNVLMLSAEDSPGATIRPRLEALGADLDRVHLVQLCDEDGVEEGLSLPDDIAELDRLTGELEPALIVVDPVMAYLGASVDAHRDAPTRRALAPLARLARDRGRGDPRDPPPEQGRVVVVAVADLVFGRLRRSRT